MAVYHFRDAEIYYGDVNLTSYANSVNLELTADALDSTTFGDSYRNRVGGLKSFSAQVSGFQDNAASGDPDHHLSQTALSTDTVLSIMPQGGDAALDDVYFGLVKEFQYQTGASVGELHTFSASAEGSDGLGIVRGDVLSIRASRTSTSDGGAQQLQTVASGQRVYGALHCFSGSGGTLDVIIKSDDSGVWGSPTTRLTFAQLSGPGSELVSAAGPITDDYWRANWTISGGTWEFAVMLGFK